MNRISVIIADDEQLAREGLQRQLSMIPGLTLIGVFAEGEKALSAILTLNPDLVILDVEMPGMGGDEVMKAMQSLRLQTKVILVSADDKREQYAQCCDGYLLKPLYHEALLGCVSNLFSPCSAKQPALSVCRDAQGYPVTETNVHEEAELFVRLKAGNEWRKIPYQQINWIEEAGDYVCIHTQCASVMGRQSLAGLEKQLNPDTFCRISSSVTINLQQMEGTSALCQNELQVYLKSGDRFRVGNEYRYLFQKLAVE